MKEFKDKAGRVVKKGDIIVYGVAYGRASGLSYGKVIDIVEAKTLRYGEKKPKIKLKNVGVDNPWVNEGHDYGFSRNNKPGYLEFTARVLVIPPECVPAAALEILNKIEVDKDEEE